MSRPTARIEIDPNDEKYKKLRSKIGKRTPKAVQYFDKINGYVKDYLPDLKRGTGDWYINYYYPKYGKKYVAFKVDSKQDGCDSDCINIAIYHEDVESHLSEKEKEHVYEKPGSFHTHGKFPYQASVSSTLDLEWAPLKLLPPKSGPSFISAFFL
ncbi:MAG: hypothetical protein FH756_10185 [Firmicutes bacterium]|nr:hypothetical protein [Bacillota bacterium]